MGYTNMLVIGITGGIGSGKSFVPKVLNEEYGACIIDTDTVAHELMEPDGIVYSQVIDAFGDGILSEEGLIDRRKLASIIFTDKKKQNLINSIVHPAVSNEVDRRIAIYRAQNVKYTAIETALLIEAGYKKKCDRVWYIYADEKSRLKRLGDTRGMDPKRARDVFDKQKSEAEFREIADDVIDNSRDEEFTKKQINDILNKYINEREKLFTGKKMVEFK